MAEAEATAYAALRARVCGLLRSADPAVAQLRSPATPEWTVHDVVAHMVGVTDDVTNGRLEGVASNPWTQAQVDKRRGAALADMVAEWDETGPAFEALMGDVPHEIAGQAVFDAVTHEHDLRVALDEPGARDSDAIDVAWQWIIQARTEAPPIRLRTPTDDVVAGVGEPAATVSATRFELIRALSGRRTVDEIARYEWEPAADPQLLLASPIFAFAAESLGE